MFYVLSTDIYLFLLPIKIYFFVLVFYKFQFMITSFLVSFSALTLLVGRLVKTEWGMLVWLSVWGEVQICIWPADATATHCLLL